MANIECAVCRTWNEFFVNDGMTFCKVCGAESQEHGHQTVVDDEGLGAFDTGGAASAVKQKRIGKKRSSSSRRRRRRRRRRGSNCEDDDDDDDDDEDDDEHFYGVSFTNVDAFSYMLKAWIEEAIVLGAKPTLRDVGAQLWFRYLKTIGAAFLTDKDGKAVGDELPLDKITSFRDIQVALTGRKRLLSIPYIVRRRRARLIKLEEEQMRQREALAGKVVAKDEDEVAEESKEARRKRSRHRRRFLDNTSDHQSSGNDDGDDGVSSCLSGEDGFLGTDGDDKNDNNDDDSSFRLSLSRLDTTSTARGPKTQKRARSSLSTDSSCSSASVGTVVEDEDEDEKKTMEAHARLMEDVLDSNRTKVKVRSGSLDVPRLKVVLAIFFLALMINEDNAFTVSCWLHWVRAGSIGVKVSTARLPREMKLSTSADWSTFLPRTTETFESLKIRKLMYVVGSFLDLGHVARVPFLCQRMDEALARFLRDMSLPLAILHRIKATLLPMIRGCLRFTFMAKPELTQNKILANKLPAFPSADVLFCALILVFFKFEYGLLDGDCCGGSRDADADADEGVANDLFFDLQSWIRLSKRRSYLAARHSHLMWERYCISSSLYPVSLEPSSAVKIRIVREQADLLETRKSAPAPVRSRSAAFRDGGNDSSAVSSDESSMSSAASTTSTATTTTVRSSGYRPTKSGRAAIRTLASSVLRNFPVVGPCLENTLDLSVSDTPLHDFALFHIKLRDQYPGDNDDEYDGLEERLGRKDVLKLRTLLAMFDAKLKPQPSSSSGDSVNDRKDLLVTHLPTVAAAASSSGGIHKKVIMKESEDKKSAECTGGKLYWMLHPYRIISKKMGMKSRQQRQVGDEGRQDEDGEELFAHYWNEDKLGAKYESMVMTLLPRNFAWVLRYLAATVGAPPMEVYLALCEVESVIEKKDRHFFGDLKKWCSPYDNKVNLSGLVQDRLC